MTYQIPLLIIVYCAIDSAVSYILRFYIALLIGAASVYTHGIFGAQLIPLAMVTGFAYVMHHFMYKKWVIPYCNFILFILIDYCIQQYFWHMPSYIEIGAMHIVVWVFVIGMLTRNKHIIPA